MILSAVMIFLGFWFGNFVDAGFSIHGRSAFAIELGCGLAMAVISYFVMREKDNESEQGQRPDGTAEK